MIRLDPCLTVDADLTVKLANRAGVPPGVINVVTTQANVGDVGKEMCTNHTVHKVSFTGSTPVAKLLYGYASRTMKKYASGCCSGLANSGL